MKEFIVSARKYRPADFESVVGQEHITDTLRNAISRNQLAHAYLFCGPRGVGKTTCARIFAKSINCLSPLDGGEACGVCESCRAFVENRSFNIHELDAASNNSVEDIRALTDQLRIPPQIGKYSVYIIDEVHMLSTNAFNAFLKSLEEPPSYAIFILATTEKHKIIPTILSRCQIYDFNRIKVADAVKYLEKIAAKEGITIDEQSLNLIAAKADGGMRDALSMFDKAVAFCGTTLNYKDVARTLNVLDYDTYFNIVDIIGDGEYRDAVLEFDRVLNAGFSPQNFTAGLSNHFRDLLMCRDVQTRKLLEVTETLLARYTEQSTRWSTESLFAAIAELSKTDATLRYATNQRLNVELCLMKLCGLGEKKNDGDQKLALPKLGVGKTEEKPVVKEAEAVAEKKSESVEQSAVEQKSEVAEQVSGQSKVSEMSGQSEGSEVSEEAKVSEAKHSGGSSFAPSITATISNITKAGAAAEKSEVQAGDDVSTIDPESEAKLSGAKEDFIEYVRNRRPRFAIVFEGVAIEGNIVKVSVPNAILGEEIEAHKGEIVSEYRRLAGINGIVELVIEIADGVKKGLPVKQDDIAAWLTEKNSAFSQLRQELSLEY